MREPVATLHTTETVGLPRGRGGPEGEDLIPVIDLSGARGDGPLARQVALEIDRTCRNSGFFIIRGHSVDVSLIEEMHRTTLDFFLQPEAIKDEALSEPGNPAVRGLYRASGYVAASEGITTAPDLCEMFTANRLGESGVAKPETLGSAYADWSTPNRWPTTPADFRDIWQAYYAALESLASDLMSLFAVGLGLQPSFFEGLIDDHISNLTANFYPPITEPPLSSQYRKGPHSDWGSLTILYQDDVGGLEVLDRKSDTWMPVPTIADTFVVNVGDLMSLWTNGRWNSTKHRVVVPQPEHWDRLRVSIPFFHVPNWSAEVHCIPTCLDTPSTQPSDTVTAGRYLLDKISAAYG